MQHNAYIGGLSALGIRLIVTTAKDLQTNGPKNKLVLIYVHPSKDQPRQRRLYLEDRPVWLIKPRANLASPQSGRQNKLSYPTEYLVS